MRSKRGWPRPIAPAFAAIVKAPLREQGGRRLPPDLNGRPQSCCMGRGIPPARAGGLLLTDSSGCPPPQGAGISQADSSTRPSSVIRRTDAPTPNMPSISEQRFLRRRERPRRTGRSRRAELLSEPRASPALLRPPRIRARAAFPAIEPETATPNASAPRCPATSAAHGSAPAAGARPQPRGRMASSISHRASFSTAWPTSCPRHEGIATDTTASSPRITRSEGP